MFLCGQARWAPGGHLDGKTIDERWAKDVKVSFATTLELLELFVNQMCEPVGRATDPLDLVEALGRAVALEKESEAGLFPCGLLRLIFIFVKVAHDRVFSGAPRVLKHACLDLEKALRRLCNDKVTPFPCFSLLCGFVRKSRLFVDGSFRPSRNAVRRTTRRSSSQRRKRSRS